MKSPFADIFIILVDNILNEEYDKPISRKDYLTFFEYFERGIASGHSEAFNSVQINDHIERVKWGRVKVDGKNVWKLSQILKTLKEKRIIDGTGYVNGLYPRRFFYTVAFENAIDFGTFDIVYEETNEKIYNILRNCKTYNESNSQYKLLKSDRFSIDVDQCTGLLMDMFKNGQISKNDALINIRRANDIHNKTNIFVVQISNGRVYTSFNSLKRELRQFCYIDNKPLLSLDLKSAQPYLFASYLLKKYPNVADIQMFYNVIVDDDIYNWTIEVMKLNDNTIMSRDTCKVEYYRYLLKSDNKGACPVKAIIKKEFPEMYEIIKKERTEIVNDNGSMANFLQGAEARIFIPVCEMFPDDCLSVHDSIYFLKSIAKDIRTKLENKFESENLVKYKLK